MTNIGFSGDYDISNWTESCNAPVPSLWNISNAPYSVVLNTAEQWRESSDKMTIKATSAGTVSFAWNGPSQNTDDCPVKYLLNHQEIVLNGNGETGGVCVSFSVNEGDEFGFKVGLTQNMSSTDFNMTIFNFTFIPA